MAGMGDTTGDIQPPSDHVKSILQMTRDSEMMQSYVRVAKADDDSDGGAGLEGIGGGDSDTVDGVGGVGVAGSHGVGGGAGGDGVSGSSEGRRVKNGRTAVTVEAAAGRRNRRRRGGGVGGGHGAGHGAGHGGGHGGAGGGGVTTTFDELTEEFKTRKSGTGGGGGGGGGIGGGGFGGGWAKRHKRDSRSRLLEEVYTDKDRAAAVNLGTRDIKASLRMKRRQDRNRTLHIPSTAESPTLLALARHCVNDVAVSLEFIDKVRGRG